MPRRAGGCVPTSPPGPARPADRQRRRPRRHRRRRPRHLAPPGRLPAPGLRGPGARSPASRSGPQGPVSRHAPFHRSGRREPLIRAGTSTRRPSPTAGAGAPFPGSVRQVRGGQDEAGAQSRIAADPPNAVCGSGAPGALEIPRPPPNQAASRNPERVTGKASGIGPVRLVAGQADMGWWGCGGGRVRCRTGARALVLTTGVTDAARSGADGGAVTSPEVRAVYPLVRRGGARGRPRAR